MDNEIIYMTGKHNSGGVYRINNGRYEVYNYKLDKFVPDDGDREEIFIYRNVDYITEEQAKEIMREYREIYLERGF